MRRGGWARPRQSQRRSAGPTGYWSGTAAAIAALLTRLLRNSHAAWQGTADAPRGQGDSENRLANFDDANLRLIGTGGGCRLGAGRAGTDHLGERRPRPSLQSGRAVLRDRARAGIAGCWASSAIRPITKDAVAGRIRRLLTMADKRAADLRNPGQLQSAVTAHTLDS